MEFSQSHESNAKTYIRKFPKMFVKGDGVILTDDDGKTYIDCLACAGALPLGHNHQVYKEAVKSFAESEYPTQMLDLMTPLKKDYLEEIYAWFPNEMKEYKYQFCSPSGSDAVEASLKLVRIATGRQNIISFSGGFHGQTLGSLLLMGNKKVKNQMGLTNFNTHVLPYPNKYLWFPNTTEEEMIEQSLFMIRQLFTDDESGVAFPAGIIVEAIQGEGGVNVAPFKWIQGISAICKEFKIPLICDEVQSGWLRTGKPFAFNLSGIIPDVVICSKAAGGGQPLAFILYKPELDIWTAGTHTGTFRGNQLGLKVGKEVLNYMRTGELKRHVKKMSKYLKTKLYELQTKYPKMIAEIRGIGLILGIQIGLGEKYNGKMAELIQNTLFSKHNIIIERGGRDGSVIRFLTSLEIQKTHIDKIMEAMTEAVKEVYYLCEVNKN